MDDVAAFWRYPDSRLEALYRAIQPERLGLTDEVQDILKRFAALEEDGYLTAREVDRLHRAIGR